jgi:multidrug transporter EmrE-like cation transporter
MLTASAGQVVSLVLILAGIAGLKVFSSQIGL